MELSEDTLRTASNDTIIIGASLGGFYAYYLAAKFKKDCLLINPVYQPAMEAKKILELEENPEKKKVIMDAANMYLTYSSNLNSMNPPANCYVALGEHDKTIDPELSSLHFSHDTVKFYDDDHYMLNSFAQVIKDFEGFLEETF